MRALILSDIHANLPALEAVLAAAPAHDVVWNLGDVVGYGASPNEVVGIASSLGDLCVRGNHDRVCSGLSSPEEFNPIAAQAAIWTRGRLTPEHRDWLRALVKGPVEVADGVLCAHGSALDEDEYLLSPVDAIEPISVAGGALHFFGHTHVQGGFATNGDEWFTLSPDLAPGDELDGSKLQLRASARYMLNPGSVGQPRDGDWRAAFAIYDDVTATVTYIRVPYDLPRAQELIYDAGLPRRLATRLSEGR